VILANQPHTSNRTLWMTSPSRKSRMLALTRVSKKLRRETLPLFFSANSFTVQSKHVGIDMLYASVQLASERELSSTLSCLSCWIAKVSRQKVVRLGNLTIHVGDWFCVPRDDRKLFDARYKSICLRVTAAVADAPSVEMESIALRIGVPPNSPDLEGLRCQKIT